MPFIPVLSCFRTFALVSASADPGSVPLLGTSSALRVAYSQHVFAATGTPKEWSYRCSCAYPLRAQSTAVGNGSHEAREAATRWRRRQTTRTFLRCTPNCTACSKQWHTLSGRRTRAGAPVHFALSPWFRPRPILEVCHCLEQAVIYAGAFATRFRSHWDAKGTVLSMFFAHALCVPTPPQSATEATKQKRPPHGGAVNKQPHLSSIHAELHCLFQAVAHSFRPSPPSGAPVRVPSQATRRREIDDYERHTTKTSRNYPRRKEKHTVGKPTIQNRDPDAETKTTRTPKPGSSYVKSLTALRGTRAR